MSSTDAAYEILKKYANKTHPLKTKQIYTAIRKGGVQLSAEQAMYRGLSRSRRFKLVGPGSWGLTEWYPKGRETRKNADGTVATLNGSDESPEEDEETA